MDRNECLKLENQLCFSLYACSRAISRMYRPLLEEMGVTYPQYLVLIVLWDRTESSVKEISDMLDLDSGTLTPMLKRMESARLITRKRSAEDERVVTIAITEEGRALQAKACCIPDALLASCGIQANEVTELNEQLKKMLQFLHKPMM